MMEIRRQQFQRRIIEAVVRKRETAWLDSRRKAGFHLRSDLVIVIRLNAMFFHVFRSVRMMDGMQPKAMPRSH